MIQILQKQFSQRLLYQSILIASVVVLALSQSQISQSDNQRREEQLKWQIQNIESQILAIKNMRFLNSPDTKYIKSNPQNQSPSSLKTSLNPLIERLKIRKYHEIYQLPQSSSFSSKKNFKNFNILETMSIHTSLNRAKSNERPNIGEYMHLLMNYNQNFYTLKGDNLGLKFEENQSKVLNFDQKRQLLVASIKKQQTYVAKYIVVKDKTPQRIELRISKLEQQNKQFALKNPFHSLIESTVQGLKTSGEYISDQNEKHFVKIMEQDFISVEFSTNLHLQYTYFFYYQSAGLSSMRRFYFILANNQTIDFFTFNQKSLKIIKDEKKSLNLKDYLQNTKGEKINQNLSIQKVIKMHNNYLIALIKGQNSLLIINLQAHLSITQQQRKQNSNANSSSLHSLTSSIFYISSIVSPNSQILKWIKYNSDISPSNSLSSNKHYFYLISQKNIYKVQLQQQSTYTDKQIIINIVEKSIMKNRISDKINNQIWILSSDYILIEERQKNKVSPYFYLIDTNTNRFIDYKLPFSLLLRSDYNSKDSSSICSSSKFIVSKNKPHQYIMSYICMIEDKQKNLEEQQSKDNQIYIEHLVLEMSGNLGFSESSSFLFGSSSSGSDSSDNFFDFTKFRIPLIAVSIGMIFYVTIKRNKKQNDDQNGGRFKNIQKRREQKRQKQMQEQIMRRIQKQKQKSSDNEERLNYKLGKSK